MSKGRDGGVVATVRSGLAPARSAVGQVLGPIATAIVFVLSLVEALLSPLADVYNRTLGRFYGEMNGLQFLMLSLGLLTIIGTPFVLEFVFGMGMGSKGLHDTFVFAAIWAIFAMSWDIQSGYTGYISFGHSVLSGAGAYGMGILLWHTDVLSIVSGLPGVSAFNSVPYLWSMQVIVTFVLGIVFALLIGLMIALPTLRLKGPYFSLITFVGVLLFTRLIPAFSGWTGGDQRGINLDIHGGEFIPLFEIRPDPVSMNYLMILIPLLLIALFLVTISRSNVGLILTAIRENEPAVSAAGINPTKFKLWSFVLSSIPMGIGGVMMSHMLRTVSMQEIVISDNSIEMIAIAVVGGISSIVGPLFAAFGFIFLEREWMDPLLHMAPFVSEDEKFLFLWLIVIAILIFARNGLFRLIWHAAGAIGGESE